MKTVLATLLSALSVGFASRIDYTGYQMYHVSAGTNVSHDALMKERMSPTMSLSFLTENLRESDIVVGPSENKQFINFLKQHNVSYDLVSENIQQQFDDQLLNRKEYKAGDLENFDYNQFHPYNEIISWIRDIHAAYPQLTELVTIGTSYEGRELLAIKITGPPTGAIKKKIFTNYAIHAREWLSPATGINMIHSMLSDYSHNAEVQFIVNNVEWTFLPITNPDGYEYTWTTDRMWRKTRSQNIGTSCVGTDPNRNWGNHWGYPGASANPCSDSYHGPSIFSEREVKSVSDHIASLNPQGYIDFHCCGEMWMTPWGWTTNYPVDYEAQLEGAHKCVDALKQVSGTNYAFGTISRVIYVASGSSVDWTYGDVGVKQSVAVELPGQFASPPAIIRPTAIETWQALLQFGFVVLNGN